MLRRPLRHLLLLVLALLLVLVPLVLVIVGQSDWAHRRLHEVVTRELAEYFKREVAVGPITGNPLTELTINGLAIAEKQYLRDGAVLTARRVVIDLDLWSVIVRRLAPLASIARIEIWGLSLRAVRDQQGVLNLEKLIPPPRLIPLEKRFRGRVIVHESSLIYLDYSPMVVRPPLMLRATEIEGNADLRKVLRLRAEASARVLDGRADRLTTRVVTDVDGPIYDLTISATNLDAGWLSSQLVRSPDLVIPTGRVDGAGALYQVKYLGKVRQDYSFMLQARDLVLAGRKLPQAVRLDGGVWLGATGAKAQGLRASIAGTTYEVAGSVHLPATTLDLALRSDRARLGPLVAALPASYRKRFAVPVSGSGSVVAQVIGPAANPNLRLRLNMQGPLTVRVADLGTVMSEGLSVTADVVSAAIRPSAKTTVAARRIEVPALQLRATTPEFPRDVAIGPMQGFQATAQLCGGRPVAQAVLRAPFVRAGEFSAGQVTTRAILANDIVRLQGLRARALGGFISADAVLQLKKPQLGVRVRGRAEGVDLARLQELPVEAPTGLAGAVNADFQAHITRDRFAGTANFAGADVAVKDVSVRAISGVVGIEGDGDLRGAGRVTIEGITHEQAHLDRAEALVRFQGQDLEVLSSYARGPDGLFWARGAVNLEDETADLQVASAEVDLGPLAERAGLERIGGALYLSGNVTGPFNDLRFSGPITVFNPRLDDYRLNALTARATLEGDTLQLAGLAANRGEGVFTGDLTLSNLGAAREQIALSGTLEGANVPLQELEELAHQDLPLTGLGEFEAHVGGTVANPTAVGTIRLANATYEGFVIGRAVIPFELRDQRLRVAEAELVVLDAPLRLTGTFDLQDGTEVDARLSGQQLRLEGLGPLMNSRLPIAGTATLQEAWLRGPVDELQGGARLIASEVMIGDETIGDVDATISLSRGQVQLEETTFQLGRGRVTLSGAVSTDTRPPTIAAQARLLQTDVPDLLYLAAPLAEALDTRPKEQRDRLQLALRSYALRVKGSVDGTLNLSGTVDAPTVVVEAERPLTAPQLVLDGRALPVIEASGRATREGVSELALKATKGDALITATGDLAYEGPINLAVDGSGISMSQLRPWIPTDIPYGGRLGFTVVAQGQTRQPDVTASVDVIEPSFAGVQFDILTVPVATVREGRVDVDTLLVKRGDEEIVLDGRLPFSWRAPVSESQGGGTRPGLLPDGPIAMGARMESTPLSFFLPLVDEYLKARRPPAPTPTAEPRVFRWASIKTEGEVNSAVTVTGTVNNPTLRGNLSVTGGSVQPEQWKTALTELQGEMEFSGTGYDNLVEVRSLGGRYDQTRGTLTGRFTLNYTRPEEFWRNGFDLRLALQSDKQVLPGGMELVGLDGALLLQTESGAQVFRPENLKVGIGGGTAALTGEARLTDMRPAYLAENQYDLHLKLDNARARYRPYLDAVANGSLDMVTPAGATRAKVSGNWQLTDGSIGLVAPPGGELSIKAVSSRLPSPDLDFVLGIGSGLTMRGAGVRAPLQVNATAAQLTGTPQRPRLVGTIVTGRGTTSLPTATLRLRGLSVQYVLEPMPGDRGDPVALRLRGTVDGTAETTIARPGARPIYILVRIAGALPDRVTITTTSDPALTETQIYALLGGVPFAYLPGLGGPEGSLGQVVSEQFLATLATAFRMRVFEPIEEELERALGLELGITFAFNQPVTLRLGKYVLKNLLITYERPLTEGNRYDVRISYDLPAGLRITYHNDERNINQIEIGYSFTF